jgi:hypothetical protein
MTQRGEACDERQPGLNLGGFPEIVSGAEEAHVVNSDAASSLRVRQIVVGVEVFLGAAEDAMTVISLPNSHLDFCWDKPVSGEFGISQHKAFLDGLQEEVEDFPPFRSMTSASTS